MTMSETRFDDFETQIQVDELSWVDFYYRMNMEGEKNMKEFFENPTQVRVIDVYEFEAKGCSNEEIAQRLADKDVAYIGGIAYHDEVICGCCGGIMKIEELYALGAEMGISEKDIIAPLPWIDISEEICDGWDE